MMHLPQKSTLFPYTTLFRSFAPDLLDDPAIRRVDSLFPVLTAVTLLARSEEHTSELQSQFHIVCRLLLEKKKTGSSARIQSYLWRYPCRTPAVSALLLLLLR